MASASDISKIAARIKTANLKLVAGDTMYNAPFIKKVKQIVEEFKLQDAFNVSLTIGNEPKKIYNVLKDPVARAHLLKMSEEDINIAVREANVSDRLIGMAKSVLAQSVPNEFSYMTDCVIETPSLVYATTGNTPHLTVHKCT